MPNHAACRAAARAPCWSLPARRWGPERVPQPRIASFGQMGRPAKLPRLLRAQIKAAVLEKLAHVAKAAQVAGFGQDDHFQISRALLAVHMLAVVATPILAGPHQEYRVVEEAAECPQMQRASFLRTTGPAYPVSERSVGSSPSTLTKMGKD